MITDEEKWHYLAVKKSFLLRGITLKHNDDYYFVNCLHSFGTENELKTHKNVCKNYGYCYTEMSEVGKKILKYNHTERSMKVPFIIYTGTESLLK